MTKKNMENGEGEKKRLNSGNMVKVRKVLGEGEDRPCSSGFWECPGIDRSFFFSNCGSPICND